MRWLLPFLLLVGPASAEDSSVFFGTWGTEAQCAGAPIQPGGSVMASPFVINDSFLQQSGIWCRLSWGPVEDQGDALVSGALALCGEDSVQGYQLGLRLTDDVLTLRWGILRQNTGLRRCIH